MDDDAIAEFIAWERQTMNMAHRLVKKHNQFHPHPKDDGHGKTIIGWLRDWGKRGISQQAATVMLNEDIQDTMLALRSRIAAVGHQRLGNVRGAALVALAMVPSLGATTVLSWNEVWQLLAAEQWDDAADALQMTGFGIAMAGTIEDRARAVALQRAIRTGKAFGPDDERALAGMVH